MLIRRFCLSAKFAIRLAVIVTLVGCSSSSSPSYHRLKQEGFYVYVLPESEMVRREWKQEITIRSFDHHCRALAASEQYNPLIVRYVGLDTSSRYGRSLFSIQIGPWVPPWAVSDGPWTEVELRSRYVDTQTGQYKEAPRSTRGVFLGIKFVDTFGQPVSVGSWLPLTETVSLINQLEYVGPPPDTVVDPWDCSK